MDTHFKKWTFLILTVLGGALLFMPPARTATITGSRLVEDFSTADYADFSASTGLWNTVTHDAEAAAVVAGNSAKPIDFGDGSDGVLDTGSGYTFNTDSHPNGYNFKSINITGGTITVTGHNPLIIRSLTTINIQGTTLSVKGGSGTAGAYNSSTSSTAGGSAITCQASGGTGGSAIAGNVAQNGSSGLQSNGTVDPLASPGAKSTGGSNVLEDAGSPLTAVSGSASWETAFTCGAGGSGGGGESNGSKYATAGGGGAAGGLVHVTAVGNISIGNAIDATGGVGGKGGDDGLGTNCGGNGSSGSGGGAWLQSLGTITSPAPNVAAVSNPTNSCFGAGNSLPGSYRADASAVAGTIAKTNSTSNAAASQNYVVQSKAYDLNVLNAEFKSAPSVTETANGGSISVQYAGSIDGSSFSPFTSDITTLSDKSYRYLKFRINLTTAGVSGASPQVSEIAVDYSDGGLSKLNLKISPGCASLIGVAGRGGDRPGGGGGDSFGPIEKKGLVLTLGWLCFWGLAYLLMRKSYFTESS